MGWRYGRGLPAKVRGGPSLTRRQELRRQRVYAATDGDVAAARVLGLHENTFRHWRRKHGLPGKSSPGNALAAEERARRLRAYEEAETDAEAARRLGMAPLSFSAWRRCQGLTNKHKRSLTPAEHQRRRAAYEETGGDREAALRLGLTLGAFADWRRKMGLAPAAGHMLSAAPSKSP